MRSTNRSLPKVIVVEDDAIMQLILIQSLESEFEVMAFDNGMDTLAYLREGNLPDVIISDLNIPLMGGLELIEQLRLSGFCSAIPVIVLSGEESTETRIQCLNAGADDFVVKPFNPRELEARIRAILRRTGKTMSY